MPGIIRNPGCLFIVETITYKGASHHHQGQRLETEDGSHSCMHAGSLAPPIGLTPSPAKQRLPEAAPSNAIDAIETAKLTAAATRKGRDSIDEFEGVVNLNSMELAGSEGDEADVQGEVKSLFYLVVHMSHNLKKLQLCN